MTRKIVPDEVRLEIHDLLDDLKRRLLGGVPSWESAKPRLVAVAEGREFVLEVPSQPKKRDLAEERRTWFENWYHELGFTVTVPKPKVSNREFDRRAKQGQALFYRPDTMGVTYEGFMIAVGQADHWTVKDEAERDKIGFESTETGYWFWAEVSEDCPRLGTSWNDLTKAIRLLSLEEYVIVWHATKALTGKMIDRRFWTWLRTRFGQSALRASVSDGRVSVHWWFAPEHLAVPHDSAGGRSAEVAN